MRLLLTYLILALFVCVAYADEADLEVNISYLEPYNNFVPGFSASIRPDLLNWGRFSLGGGLGIHVSSRFNYETTPWIWYGDTVLVESDSSYYIDFYYYDENLIEIVNYEAYLEGRLRLVGEDEDAHWKSWLTLHVGIIDNSSIRTQHRTLAAQDSVSGEIYDFDDYTSSFKTEHSTNLYFSPGISIGIGNFIAGYRHWIHFDESSLIKGEPARQLGTIRVGYRFIW